MFKLKLISLGLNPLKIGGYWRHQGGDIFKVIKVTPKAVWFAWDIGEDGLDCNRNDSGGIPIDRWFTYTKDGVYIPVSSDVSTQVLREFKL